MKKSLLLGIVVLIFLTSCEKEDSEKSWVYIGETQCANPWDNLGLGSTESNVAEYLKSNDVRTYDFRVEIYSYGPFCAACNCSSGRIIHVQIQNSDIERTKALGFNE